MQPSINHPPGETDPTGLLRLPVDPEPVSLGLALLLILLAAVIVFYSVLDMVIPGGGLNFIAAIASMVLAALFLQVIERWVKRLWRPVRFLEVMPDQIQLIRKGHQERALDPRRQINVITWHFEVRRRSRAPKGWHVVGLALEQEEAYIVLYTLVSPERFGVLNSSGRFVRLQRTTLSATGDRDMRAAGQQRRIQMAEAARGLEGAELTVEHFQECIEHLQAQFPRWMPRS